MGIRGMNEQPAVTAAIDGFNKVLGANPQGAAATVKARLDSIESTATTEASTRASADTTLTNETLTGRQYAWNAFPVMPEPSHDIPTFSVSGPGGPNPQGASITSYTYNTANVSRLGCYPVTVNQFSTDYQQNQVAGQTGAGAQPWAVEFETLSPDIVLMFRCAANPGSRFWVWVDGRPVRTSPYAVSGNISAGSLSFFRIQFGASKLRRIRIYLRLADFGGLTVPNTYTISATTKPETIKAAFYGDSWYGGTANLVWPRTLAGLLGFSLGWETFLCGIGGTGYASGSPNFLDSTRLANLYAVAPDYVIVNGSINDNAAASATVQANAASLFAAIASNLPSAKVIVFGPQPIGNGYATSSLLLANRDAVRTSALAASNVLGFVDPIAEKWLNGSGHIGSYVGDGNNDFYRDSDLAHPTQAGAAYYANRMQAHIVRLLTAAGRSF